MSGPLDSPAGQQFIQVPWTAALFLLETGLAVTLDNLGFSLLVLPFLPLFVLLALLQLALVLLDHLLQLHYLVSQLPHVDLLLMEGSLLILGLSAHHCNFLYGRRCTSSMACMKATCCCWAASILRSSCWYICDSLALSEQEQSFWRSRRLKIESRMSMFLLTRRGVLRLWQLARVCGELILLIIAVFHEIKLQLKYGWMSLRKEQRRRMQAVLQVINSSLQQTPRQISSQEQIDQGIVEELLQGDVLAGVNSVPALKLVIYELILHISQQSANSNPQSTDFSPTLNRISNLLNSIHEVLADLVIGNQEHTLKSIDRRNGKEFLPLEKTYRSKMKVLSSYYHQFCTLAAQMNHNDCKGSSHNFPVQSPDDALIEQLENLVFKKEGIIQALQREKEQFKNKMRQAQAQLEQLKDEHKQLFSQKLCIEEERDKLRTELLQIMRFQPQSTIEHQQCQSEVGKCFWNNQTEKTIAATNSNIQLVDTELMMCLLSQALTIEALLQ